MLVCLYEDRIEQIPGLKLLLLSLLEYCPTWPVRLHFPDIPASLKAWLAAHARVEVCESPMPGGNSYNVKPEVLLDGLRSGAKMCLWLDTDVLVNGSLTFLETWPLEELVVAEDPWEHPLGSTNRAITWGLTPGRNFPGPINSSVVRVSARHIDILIEWSCLTKRLDYLAGQSKPPSERNQHMLSDQDAFSALVASERFSTVPVRRLVQGRHILQHHGAGAFGPRERWMVLRNGVPPLLHAMGTVKPWRMAAKTPLRSNPRGYYERLYLELSPYVTAGRKYRKDLSDPDTSWLEVRTAVGKLDFALLGWSTPARGFLQAALHRTAWRSRLFLTRMHNRWRWRPSKLFPGEQTASAPARSSPGLTQKGQGRLRE